jgi:hypothetical protein
MEYLKSYKLFESKYEWNQSVLTDEVWNDISDILLELEDEGLLVNKYLHDDKKISNKLCEDVIEIVVNKTNVFSPDWELTNYDEVKDTFMRLIDYLEPYGWNYSIFYFAEHNFIEFECGGKDPLAKVYNPNTPNQLEAGQASYAFKICFYQGIDKLIS